MITTAQHNLAMEQAWGVIREMSADELNRVESEAMEKTHCDIVARLRSAELHGHTKYPSLHGNVHTAPSLSFHFLVPRVKVSAYRRYVSHEELRWA